MSSLNPIGIPFIELPSVDSTNNYAMGLVHEGMAQHGTAVFTMEQTRGKGQRNKHWNSQKGQNIALSLVIEPGSLTTSELFLLSMSMATGVNRFIKRFVPNEVKIKWPNDIYWRDRKAAGILIENVWQGKEWKFAIVGIGININQTDFGGLDSKAVSLKQITGKDFDLLLLTKELCKDLENQYRELISEPSKIITGYKKDLYKINEIVKFKNGNRIFEAIIKDVSMEGRLVVQHALEERFDVGELEWLV